MFLASEALEQACSGSPWSLEGHWKALKKPCEGLGRPPHLESLGKTWKASNGGGSPCPLGAFAKPLRALEGLGRPRKALEEEALETHGSLRSNPWKALVSVEPALEGLGTP